jgi:hypothetical protein
MLAAFRIMLPGIIFGMTLTAILLKTITGHWFGFPI